MTDEYTIEGVNNGIDNLINEIQRLQSENTRLKAELDKAVEDLADVADCIICKYDDVCENSNSQGCCNGNWQWRGLEVSK